MVRTTDSWGWTTRWIERPSWPSSAETESTRNGMSSVTTSTTVCPEAQPCSSTVGVKTRTRAVPCGRFAASSRWEYAAPATSTGSRPSEVLGGDPSVVAVEEGGVLGVVERAGGVRCAVEQFSLGVVELAEHRRSHH